MCVRVYKVYIKRPALEMLVTRQGLGGLEEEMRGAVIKLLESQFMALIPGEASWSDILESSVQPTGGPGPGLPAANPLLLYQKFKVSPRSLTNC